MCGLPYISSDKITHSHPFNITAAAGKINLFPRHSRKADRFRSVAFPPDGFCRKNSSQLRKINFKSDFFSMFFHIFSFQLLTLSFFPV